MAERTSRPMIGRMEPLTLRIAKAVPLNIEGLNIAAGIRAAFACALPVFIGELLDIRAFSWIAIVAFWGCLVDSGGAWRTRFGAMASFTVFAAIGCLLAVLAKASLWFSVPFVFVWSFCGSLVRIFGSAASTVGLLLSTPGFVTPNHPSEGLAGAIELSALTLAAA